MKYSFSLFLSLFILRLSIKDIKSICDKLYVLHDVVRAAALWNTGVPEDRLFSYQFLLILLCKLIKWSFF